MEIIGDLKKMRVELNSPVKYFIDLNEDSIYVNELINKEVKIKFNHTIHCMKCGRLIKKSYGQGYCYPCFISIPETEECVFRPELCRAHEGIARDIDYAKKHCLQEHIVYLAISSGLKVGVTRKTQIPIRWIDQGAVSAIVFAVTPNRYLAGKIEVELKKHLADRTNWRKMLIGDIDNKINLIEQKQNAAALLPDELKNYIFNDNEITQIDYPVQSHPEKVKSFNFDKNDLLSGILMGVKGQYLMFNDNTVVNIRKYGGYNVSFNF